MFTKGGNRQESRSVKEVDAERLGGGAGKRKREALASLPEAVNRGSCRQQAAPRIEVTKPSPGSSLPLPTISRVFSSPSAPRNHERLSSHGSSNTPMRALSSAPLLAVPVSLWLDYGAGE
jgi:hypothetical protein